MNWFTKAIVVTKSLESKKELIDEWGGCIHVEEDPSKLYAISYENDSFGLEGYCLCKDCLDMQTSIEDEEILTCHDCGAEHPRKEMKEWRWYDFYAAQGDEALIICPKCRVADKHVARVKKDRKDMMDELYPDHHEEDDCC